MTFNTYYITAVNSTTYTSVCTRYRYITLNTARVGCITALYTSADSHVGMCYQCYHVVFRSVYTCFIDARLVLRKFSVNKPNGVERATIRVGST